MPKSKNEALNQQPKITKEDTYDFKPDESGLRFNGKAVWVVVHTRAGYEYKVQDNIRKLAESRNMSDKILAVEVPTKDVIEKNAKGQQVVKTKKLFPAYVYVKMIVNTDTWYLVRNADGVTGFVGVGVEPTPLLESEIKQLHLERKVEVNLDIHVGDVVNIIDGPFENYSGKIESLDVDRRTLRVIVEMFNRETPVELNFDQVETL